MGGKIRVSLRDEPAKPKQQREEIPRIVRLLALAHRWHRLIDEGQVENQAEIARLMNLTGARVSQIMALRGLFPDFQERLVMGPIGTRQEGERSLRLIAARTYWSGQSDGQRLPKALG
jgi:integrase